MLNDLSTSVWPKSGSFGGIALQRPSLIPATRRIAGFRDVKDVRSMRYMYSETSSSISTWSVRSGCRGVPINWLRMIMLSATALRKGAMDGSSVSAARWLR